MIDDGRGAAAPGEGWMDGRRRPDDAQKTEEEGAARAGWIRDSQIASRPAGGLEEEGVSRLARVSQRGAKERKEK